LKPSVEEKPVAKANTTTSTYSSPATTTSTTTTSVTAKLNTPSVTAQQSNLPTISPTTSSTSALKTGGTASLKTEATNKTNPLTTGGTSSSSNKTTTTTTSQKPGNLPTKSDSNLAGGDYSGPISKIRVRLPDGSQVGGNFAASASLESVLQYALAQFSETPNGSTFTLVNTYPRRKFSSAELKEATLQSAGMRV
jgi:hypothetical protein